jgi:glycerophosphoryl diester phosphodiesterase
MNRPLIIAHRGSHDHSTENTLSAFEAAIALKADLIELDVRCTQDRVLVVHHDPAIQNLFIEDLTWLQVQRLKPEVPTLEQAIACCKGRIRLDIEIKEPGYEVEVVQELEQLSVKDFVITSFYLSVIRSVREMSADITLGFLMNQETLISLNEEPLMGKFLQAMKIAFVAPHWLILDSPLLTQHLSDTWPYWVWTVNDSETMQRLCQNPRIQAIITDRIDLAIRLKK